ncbi:hypothetical protein [Schaalia sp. ZJ405]|nr:hypothetical protein [Schaalia sp. ZJ405]
MSSQPAGPHLNDLANAVVRGNHRSADNANGTWAPTTLLFRPW